MSSPTQVSSQVRQVAIRALSNTNRPLSTHEIENHIKNHYSELWSLIMPKCGDYVRVILSVTHDGTLDKYKARKGIRGIDKRSTFYGLPNRQYNEKEWEIIPTPPKNESEKKTPEKSKVEKLEQSEQLSNSNKEFDPSSTVFGLSDSYNEAFSPADPSYIFDCYF